MIAIKIDTSGFKQLQRDLAKMQKAIPLAIAQGLNEGGDRVRTQVRRSLQQQTSLVRYNSVVSRTSTIRAYDSATPKSGIGPVGPGNLTYAIVVRGKPSTRPDEFAYRVTKGKGGGVTVRMWGVDHKFKRSFQIAGNTGAHGLRMRTEGPREPIRGFDGPNLAKELGQGAPPSVFIFSVAEFVPGAILKRLAKVFGA